MNIKTLIILALLAIGLGWLAVHLTQKPPVKTEKVLFLPEIKNSINNVTDVLIKKDSNEWHFVQKDAKWTAVHKSGYPIEFDKLRKLLVGVVDLVKIEQKTSNPDLYSRLNLEPIDAKEAKSKQLLLKDKDGKVVLDLLIGKEQMAKSDNTKREIYVRKATEKASWLVMGELAMPYNEIDWLLRDLVDIEKDTVARVTITSTSGESYTLSQEKQEKTEDQHFVLENPTTGSVQPMPSVMNQIADALSSLRMNDVKPIAEVEFKQTSKAVFTTHEGLEISIDIVKLGEDSYAKVIATANEESQKAKADELNAKLDGWAFELPTYKAGNLTKPLSELLPKPEEEDDKAAVDKLGDELISVDSLLDAAATPGTVK